MRNAMYLWRSHTQSFHDRGGNTVKQVNRPMKCVKEPLKRQCHQQRNTFGAGKAQCLRDQLSNHHVQCAQQRERTSKGDCMRDQHSVRSRFPRPDGLKDLRQSGFASAPIAKLVSVMPSCTPETTRCKS